MVAPSIDNLGGRWAIPTLPVVEPFSIPVGASIAFAFPAPTPSEAFTPTSWVCTIHVVEHRGGTDEITPRVLPLDDNGQYAGFLTTDETAGLTAGKYYFIVAIFTATDRQVDQFVRFQVRDQWVAP
jgi:hypothetical protein